MPRSASKLKITRSGVVNSARFPLRIPRLPFTGLYWPFAPRSTTTTGIVRPAASGRALALPRRETCLEHKYPDTALPADPTHDKDVPDSDEPGPPRCEHQVSRNPATSQDPPRSNPEAAVSCLA